MWVKLQPGMTAALVLFLISVLAFLPRASAIGCFVCSSVNGSHPDCEDRFNNTNPSYYQPQCESGRKDRKGTFPGTSCIKVTAELGNHTVVVRSCTVDSGGVNSETELGRESHCWMVGEVRFNDKKMRGCTVACYTDGCNTAVSTSRGYSWLFAVIASGLTVLWATRVKI